MGNNQKLRCSSYIVIEPNNFKILQTLHMEFFGLVIPLDISLEIGRKYVSLIITIVNNITVLVSHNVICSGYFMPMSHGVNKKAPQLSPLTFPSLPGFHKICLLFYKEYFINLPCSCQIIAKDNAFSK